MIPVLPTLPSIPGLGRSGSGGGGFDPDAQSYFSRVSGITDPNKAIVNDLVVDLKAASLWTPLSAAWIGRSAFNAGSGTTVYELKSDTNNGTLVNSAGWSADGLTFGNTQHMSSSFLHDTSSGIAPWTFYAIFKVAGDTATDNRLWGSASGATPTMLYFLSSNKTSTQFGVYDTITAYTNAVASDVTVFTRIAVRCVPIASGLPGAPLTEWFKNGSSTSFAAISNAPNCPDYPVYFNHPDSQVGHGTETIAFGAIYQGVNLVGSDLATLDSVVMASIGSGL